MSDIQLPNTPDSELQDKLFNYLWLLSKQGRCPDDLAEFARQIHDAHARLEDQGRGEDFLAIVAQQHAKDGDYVYAFEALLQWAFLREFGAAKRHQAIAEAVNTYGVSWDYNLPYE